MNHTEKIFFTAFGLYVITYWISTYSSRNFPNRRFVVIKNKVLFYILGSVRGKDSVQNIWFYPQQKITLTGFIMHIVNIIVLLSIFIFPDIQLYFNAYVILFAISCVLILLLEPIVYFSYKRTLPKKFTLMMKWYGNIVIKLIVKASISMLTKF